jgi:hypothetical protein
MATDSNNLESIQYCLNFIILGSTTIGSTTTTTQVVITTPTTNNISLVLGLGLSLALLLILTSVLLCGCCCWHPGFCWYVNQSIFLSFQQKNNFIFDIQEKTKAGIMRGTKCCTSTNPELSD